MNADFKQFINKCDLDGSTALHLAVQTGSKDVSQVLIQYGADVNCQNKSLQTPVYLAAVGGHQDVLKMLILQGGDMNASDSQQRTALHRYLLNNPYVFSQGFTQLNPKSSEADLFHLKTRKDSGNYKPTIRRYSKNTKNLIRLKKYE